MLNTVQDIFDISIRLIDAQNESTGSTKTADTKEYELRTPSLLNSILDRAYPASDTYAAAQEAAGPESVLFAKKFLQWLTPWIWTSGYAPAFFHTDLPDFC